MSNNKVIIIGVVIGIAYFIGIELFVDEVTENAKSYNVKETIYINEGTPATPNDGYSFDEEVTYFEDDFVQLVYEAKENSVWILICSALVLWSIFDIVYYPNGRKLSGGFIERLFKPSKIEVKKRLCRRNLVNNIFYGILISIPIYLLFKIIF